MDKPSTPWGWSINSLAMASGIPYATLHRKLSRPEAFTMGEVLRLAEVLDATPGEIIADLVAFEAAA